jgi:hypothetical protein
MPISTKDTKSMKRAALPLFDFQTFDFQTFDSSSPLTLLATSGRPRAEPTPAPPDAGVKK